MLSGMREAMQRNLLGDEEDRTADKDRKTKSVAESRTEREDQVRFFFK